MKKSLFKGSAWSAKSASTGGNEQSIFQQNVYEDILAANKKNEERRLARRKQKDEQRRKSGSKETKVDDDRHPVKKQRLSNTPIDLGSGSESHDNHSESGSESDSSVKHVKSTRKKQQSTAPPRQKSGQSRTSPRSGQDHRDQKLQEEPVASDDDDLIVIEPEPVNSADKTQARKRTQTPEDSDSDPDADEFVKELKRAAREEARRKKLVTVQRRVSPAADAQSSTSGAQRPSHMVASAQGRESATPSVPDPDDPIVHLRITTIIPGCEELFIQRRASQPLDIVLETFVKRHELRPELARKVFFTWNGTRLFKSTTSRSILAMIKSKHGTKRDGGDLAEGKIEIEAVTDEIFEHRKQQKERERKRLGNGESWNTPGQDANNDEAAAQADAQQNSKPPGIVLQLRSNDEEYLPSMNLRVRADTTIVKIVRGYKKKNKIDMTREVYLVFEGDRLQDEQTAEEIGFEDMDTVDLRSA